MRPISINIISNIDGLAHLIQRECKIRHLLSSCHFIFHSSWNDDSEILLADPGLVCSKLDSNFSKLKWFQSTFAGVNKIIDETSRSNYLLTRIGSGFGPQMVEYVLGWALCLQLNIPQCISDQNKSLWMPLSFAQRGLLSGKKMGILGAGQIGTSIAQASLAFGIQPLGLSTRKPPSTGIDPYIFLSQSVDEVIQRSDIIVNCLPSTPSTRYLLTLDRLSQLNTANPPLFINIGRGDIISAQDLLTSVESRLLSAAVLDVFESEPLSPSSPLWSHPRIHITPHISAVSTKEIVSQIFLDNLERYVVCMEKGESPESTLLHLVDRVKGY
jgi:phosphoglycerate dehydrogenase-like enzyme